MTGRDDGFTLIELLVALALMAMIGGLTVTALRSGRIMLDRSRDQQEDGRVDAVQSYLRRVLGSMRPLRRPAEPLEAALIHATPETLEFITTYTPPGQFQGIYLIALSIRPTGDRFELNETRTLFRQPIAGKPSPSTSQTTSVLLHGLTSARWRYFGAVDDGGSPVWSNDWPHRLRLPAAVGLDAQWPETDKRSWSPLVMQIPASE